MRRSSRGRAENPQEPVISVTSDGGMTICGAGVAAMT
jgi:hypothetical protein